MINPALITTRTQAHTLENVNTENHTGVRKKRIKRTSNKNCLTNPLKTGGYKKTRKRIKSELQGNRLANQKINKHEHMGNKKMNEINEVRFQVRSDSLLQRTSETQSYQGLRGSFNNRFALFAFCD